ncbi:MAG: GNAT family N-acetyltransferase [Planctomycetota bacterium]
MIFETSRLLLRELCVEDAEALQEIVSDPRVTRYLPFDPQTLEQTRKYIAGAVRDQKTEPRVAFDFAIVVRSEHDRPDESSHGGGVDVGSMTRPTRLIGRCGLGVNRPEHREAMMWYLLHPSHWGKGYAFEAASALLGFGFTTLDLHRVFADCDPRNTASCRVAERLGMVMEGRLRENYYLKGEWCSAAMYGILEGEWRGRQKVGSMT